MAIQEGIDNLLLLKRELPGYIFFTKIHHFLKVPVMLHFMIRKEIQEGPGAYYQSNFEIYNWEGKQKSSDRPIQILNNEQGHYIINLHAPHELKHS